MLNKVNDLVIRGKAKLITGAVAEALEGGCVPEDILNTMIAGMDVVGERFKNGEIFVPEMLIAAKAMKKGVEVLKPHLASGAAGALGKVVIGTVAGDLHDIGKNLVAMMIESAGFDVIDLGVDAHPFMEGNGRSTRIWLDLILKTRLQRCVDWSKISKNDYLQAMQTRVVNASPIHGLLSSALTDKINDRETFMKGIDYSYYYEQEE